MKPAYFPARHPGEADVFIYDSPPVANCAPAGAAPDLPDAVWDLLVHELVRQLGRRAPPAPPALAVNQDEVMDLDAARRGAGPAANAAAAPGDFEVLDLAAYRKGAHGATQ